MRRLMRIGACLVLVATAVGIWVGGAGSKTLPRAATKAVPHVNAVQGTSCFVASGSVCSRPACAVPVQARTLIQTVTVPQVATVPEPVPRGRLHGGRWRPLAVKRALKATTVFKATPAGKPYLRAANRPPGASNPGHGPLIGLAAAR